ncbi:MAG TPA: fibronectin type III domain-containing protein [Pseudobacteroides sp.]|uniref:fibronectin type III domain-containing protein n=1 Tax=Pseudobacteroides sp. TaxID=1968840 RepID=UPI002F95208B
MPELGGARITSCPIDEGTARNCFDGDINTLALTAKVNPAWVQIEFPQKVEISSAKVSLGQPGYYDTVFYWWLECADSQVDLDNKTDSYRLAVSKKNTTIDAIWDEMELMSPLTRKIWKFTIQKSRGDDFIPIPELQLWSYYQGIKLDMMSFVKSDSIKVQADNSINNNVDSTLDENPATYFKGNNPSNIIVDMGNLSVIINRIRFFVGKERGVEETDRLVLEAADSIGDLNTKSGTYKLVYGKGRDLGFENWEDIILSIPIKQRYWRFYTKRVDSKQSPNISEIEFWADQRYCDYPPAAPSHLKVTERKENYAVLEWSSTKDATGSVLYNVYRNNKLINTTSACKFKDTGLKPQDSYTYHIKAYNIIRKLSEQSPIADALPVAVQSAVISPTDIPTNMPTNMEIGVVPSKEVIEDPVEATGRSSVMSTEDAKPTVKVPGEDVETHMASNTGTGGISLKTKIVLSVFVITIAFLAWLIMAAIKMKKKIRINQKKREAELDTIKQLLMEEKTEHVIDLLDKKDKR